MKHLFTVLFVTLLGAASFATEPEKPWADVLGTWRTERPTSSTPYAISHGEVTIDEENIFYTSICSYTRGPVLKVSVAAPIAFQNYGFEILEGQHGQIEGGGYTCDAYVSAGFVEFRVRGDKLILFNRQTGWRGTFIR